MEKYVENLLNEKEVELEYFKNKMKGNNKIIDTEYIEIVIKIIKELQIEVNLLNKILIES